LHILGLKGFNKVTVPVDDINASMMSQGSEIVNVRKNRTLKGYDVRYQAFAQRVIVQPFQTVLFGGKYRMVDVEPVNQEADAVRHITPKKISLGLAFALPRGL
jgi:hypothetical protein